VVIKGELEDRPLVKILPTTFPIKVVYLLPIREEQLSWLEHTINV
jgi:hypothetical protein